MLHSALATAPDRPMVPVAAAVAGIALVGAMLVLAAGIALAPHQAAAVLPPAKAIACPAVAGCTDSDMRDAARAPAPR